MSGSATRAVFSEQGRLMLENGDDRAALDFFRAAHTRNPGDARLRSYLGVCVGRVERRFEESIELCHSALEQEFFNPELYLNLARVHLSFGFKSEAIRHLRRGLMIDPGNQSIREQLQGLGARRRQMLGFLPRRHALNRWLGRLLHRIAGSPDGPPA